MTMAKFIETYQGGKAIVYEGYKFTKGKKESVKDLSTCVYVAENKDEMARHRSRYFMLSLTNLVDLVEN